MRVKHLLPFLLALPLAATACGGDDGAGDDTGDDDTPAPDAGPPDASNACAELTTPQGSIAVPGEFAGTVNGEGSDLNVADGICDVTINTPSGESGYYEPVGEDAVVHLTGLTSGTVYGVILDTEDDLGFYVISGCTAGTIGTGQCALFDDVNAAGPEQATFTADGTEAWVVVDNAELQGAPPAGTFTLKVVAHQCDTSFDCEASAPVCEEFACVASPNACTGDDVEDTTGDGDDSPVTATTLTAPTEGVPTIHAAAVCAEPATESDWYKVTLQPGDYVVQVDWVDDAADLDFYVVDSSGAILEGAISTANPELLVVTIATAGDYYLQVVQYEPAAAAATPYTLTLRVPECDTSFDCALPTEPLCNGVTRECTAGPATCTGDDAGDTTGDDGPAAARLLVSGVATDAAVCNARDGEADFYKIAVAAGEGLTIDVAWTGTTDLDVVVLDSTGNVYGESFWKNPEHVVTTYLPAGTYVIAVTMFTSTPVTAAQQYTITATQTADQTCATSADCAAAYSTQIYRGSCDVGDGACKFIATTGGAANTACDSASDCTSGFCSYIAFESDAQKSVCVPTCTAAADCAAITGTTCTTGFNTNICVPSCAADLECGANVNGATLDANQPWDYWVCTEATGVCSPS